MRVVLYCQFVTSRFYSVLSQICLVLIQSCVVSPIAVLFWLSFLVCLYKGWASRIYNLCKTRLQFHAGMLYFASNLFTPGPKGWLNTLISTIDRMQYQKSVSGHLGGPASMHYFAERLSVDCPSWYSTKLCMCNVCLLTARPGTVLSFVCATSVCWLRVLVKY